MVARVLHEQLGAFMGERFREPTEENPQGYWEDLDFKECNAAFLTGQVPFEKWSVIISELAERRSTLHTNWGLKDPRLCYLLGLYLSIIDDPVIVRCNRDAEKVAPSMTKNYGWPIEAARRTCFDRSARLDKLLKGRKVHSMDFTETRTDEEVEQWLSKILFQ